MSARSVFPPAAVFQSANPADRTSHRSSLGVVRVRAACACVLAWRDVPRKACARAGVARRATKRRRKECRPKKDKGQKSNIRKKAACVLQAARPGSAIAAASWCVRSDPSDASPVQGARATVNLCRGGNCRRACVCCVVPAVVTYGDVAADTCACASCSGRVSGGVWQYGRRWPAASS